jgi:hypothetical protein
MESVLNPVRTVRLAAGDVEVRELRAIDAQYFLRLVAERASGLSNGEGFLDFRRMAEMVAASAELANHLVLKSCGKTEAWLSEITLEEFMGVLDAAMDINFTEALEKKAAAVGARVARLMNLNASSPAPSISSSARVTPAPGTTPSDS